MVSPERKNMVWAKGIIQKLTFFGGLIVNCCTGLFLVANASMFLPQHRQFVGCILNSECVTSCLLQFVLVPTL